MVKRNYNMKKTISMKQFIVEFGQDFSTHMKQRLMELGGRCILTRKENSHILDLKHVEHTKYDSDCNGSTCKKEYAYGQLIIDQGKLYFSENSAENDDVMQIPIVKDIYNSLTEEETIFETGLRAKHINDEKLDYVVDQLLDVCPEVSAEHMAIIAKYSNIAPINKSANR